MNKQIILISVSVTAILSIVIFYCFTAAFSEKTAYVDISKLFEEFKLKKELEVQLGQIKNARKSILDSLELNLKVMAKQIQSEGQKDKTRIQLFEIRREEFLEKKRQFEDDDNAVTKQYDGQIVSQLNQYVKDYGNKHGYTYIFGADGSGFLMFSTDKKDITEEVKKYINERYKGKAE